MRKEILFAIIAGVLFGAVLAFGIWRANSALKEPSESVASLSPTPPDVAEEVTKLRLSLATPTNLDVITQTPVSVSGVTTPNAWIVVSAEKEDYIFQANSDGDISIDVDLVGGVNQILTVSFDEGGDAAREILALVYSTEFINEIPESSDETNKEDSNEGENAIRDKVQEKLEEALNNPKAYLGSITDILEDSIQIKSETGEFQQMAVSEQTEFVKIGDSTQDIDFDDVAIGDYAVSMGYITDTDVLDARRVLITAEPEKLSRRIILGKVLSIERGKFTLETSETEFSVEAVRNADISIDNDGERESLRFSEISEGDELIAVGTIVDGDFLARKIQITSPSETDDGNE